MIQIIRKSDYKVMPWKNGQGITSEIAIDPPGADFAAEDFQWRLSAATISTPGSFSQFAGYDRILTVWRGAGLQINGVEHTALQPFAFSGELPVDCVPQGEVTDLGLIYRRDKFQAVMEVKHLLGRPQIHDLKLEKGLHFLTVINGEMRLEDGAAISAEETLRIENMEQLHLRCSHTTTMFHLRLWS